MSIKVLIIGGGFYGASIAKHIDLNINESEVYLIEKENDLITKASFNNQARIHNGYHYPRSFTTAYRSHENFSRFCNEWSSCLELCNSSFYAISKKNTKTNSLQFERFLKQIGSEYEEANDSIKSIFNPDLIENVFSVKEHIFNAIKLREKLKDLLFKSKVRLLLNNEVINIKNGCEGKINIEYINHQKEKKYFEADFVFNCTYSKLSQFENSKNLSEGTGLKHEMTEIALVKVPKILEKVSITVLDGPFFSIMPFPIYGNHSFTHVRYTPHFSWNDKKQSIGIGKLKSRKLESNFEKMVLDSQRYLPILKDCIYKKSLYEIKTTLINNEHDDGRPILIKKDENFKGFYSILGSKFDNIYDVLEYINNMFGIRK